MQTESPSGQDLGLVHLHILRDGLNPQKVLNMCSWYDNIRYGVNVCLVTTCPMMIDYTEGITLPHEGEAGYRIRAL